MSKSVMSLMIREAVASSASKGKRSRDTWFIRARDEYFVPYSPDQRIFNDEPWRRNGKRKGKRVT